MRFKSLLVLSLLVAFQSFFLQGAEYVTVKLEISAFEGLKLQRPLVIVYENFLPVDTIDIWNSGNERIKLETNKTYLLEVRQTCYVPVMMSLSTVIPSSAKWGGSIKIPVVIYPYIEKINYSLFNIPIKHYAFNYVLEKFDEYAPYSKSLANDFDGFLRQLKEASISGKMVDKKKASFVKNIECDRLLRLRDQKVRKIQAELIAKRIDYIGKIDSSYYASFLINDDNKLKKHKIDIAKIERDALLRKEEVGIDSTAIILEQKESEKNDYALLKEIEKLKKDTLNSQTISVQDVIASEAIITQKKAKITTLKEYNMILKEEESSTQKYYEDVIYLVSKKKRLVEEVAETKREHKMLVDY